MQELITIISLYKVLIKFRHTIESILLQEDCVD